MSPSASASNGDDAVAGRPLTPGIYPPTVAFFHPDTDELDVKTTARHAVHLAQAGVAGLAVQGSNGEAVHLLHDERDAITQATRAALDDAGFAYLPLLVGCGAQSTFETVRLCQRAAAAGGDYALVLPPSYYCGIYDNGDVAAAADTLTTTTTTTTTTSSNSVLDFFFAVADASPIPLIVYSYPGVTPGVDLSSDLLAVLSRHGNIVGCKFTCANTGKLARVAAAAAGHNNNNNSSSSSSSSQFFCFAGSADFTLPAMAAGASGVISGLANVAPRACVRLFELAARQGVSSPEAARLQDVVGRADWVFIRTGVVGVRAALNHFAGYGGWSRRPLPRPDPARAKGITDELEEVMELERTLASKA